MARFERFVTLLVAVAAVLVASASVMRRFERGASPTGATDPSAVPVLVSDWQTLVDSSTRRAQVVVVEFSDFECPFCRRFHLELERLKPRFGDRLAVQFIHYPLPQHRFAVPAARAAECARLQGRFDEYAHALFAAQDSLGLKSWLAYASTAGISDTVAFRGCVEATATPAAVEAGVAAGRQLNIVGTPTVLVNGWRYAVPPYDSLEVVLQRALDRAASRAP